MDKKELDLFELKKEIDQLRNKMNYFIGSLETINYLLTSDNEVNFQNHLDHVKEIVSRMIKESKSDLIDLN
jgi:hypothetical protein